MNSVPSSFTNIIEEWGGGELDRTPEGDLTALDYGFALYTFRQLWNGHSVNDALPSLEDINNIKNNPDFGVYNYVSFDTLFNNLEAWCVSIYGGSLSETFPDLSKFFINIAQKWYNGTGLGTDEIPCSSHWDLNEVYSKSFLNASQFSVVPPSNYLYSYQVNVGVATFTISNNIVVPLQLLNLSGEQVLIDTYPNILQSNNSLDFYRMLQILLGYLSNNNLSEEPSRNIEYDFATINTLLRRQGPKLVYCDFSNLANSTALRILNAQNMNTVYSPVILEKLIDELLVLKNLVRKNAKRLASYTEEK